MCTANNNLLSDIVANTTFDSKEAQVCQRVLSRLTEKQIELTAQSSYAYWKFVQHSGEAVTAEQKRQRQKIRQIMASREIARYYEAAQQDEDLTTTAIKRTCGYRETYRLELIRSCLDCTDTKTMESDEAAQFRDMITSDLSKQHMVVKAGVSGQQGVLLVGARTSMDIDEKGFLIATLYMLERAVAVTENLSRGLRSTVDVVVDASCFKSKYSPSRHTLKTLLIRILQDHYPNRLNKLVFVDPPYWLSSLYRILTPFLDRRTQSKFLMARRSNSQRILSSVLLSPEYFNKTCEEKETVDAVQFVTVVPFHQTLDTEFKNALMVAAN